MQLVLVLVTRLSSRISLDLWYGIFCYRISVAGITASPSDYTVANNIELTFTPSGPSTQFFSFTPTDDDRVENNETVLATLSTTDLQTEILINHVQITIKDNDSMFYFFLVSLQV